MSNTTEEKPVVDGSPREDEFVYRIVKDPKNPPEILLLVGFAGRASEEDSTRIYLDAHLSAFVDVPNDAILHAQDVPREQSQLGGHFVWIRRDSDLIQQVRESYLKSTQLQQEFFKPAQPETTGLNTAFPAWPGMPPSS